MQSTIVAHYAEVGTKGGNRSVFERCLIRNIEFALHELPSARVRMTNQRILVSVDDAEAEAAKARMADVFGIAWFAGVSVASRPYPSILEASRAVLSSAGGPGRTFRVSSRRSDKAFEMSSLELNRRLGEDLRRDVGMEVNLGAPDVDLHVDVLSDRALVYRERTRGLGGLPVGVSGKVLHLLSGGIDSPVAAWLMMKRGCRPLYLHFYVAPAPDAVLGSKIMGLARVLSRYSGRSEVVLIPFAPYQLATTGVPTEFEPVVFRRFMRMVAERLARSLGLVALSTGDNLAQVASQTLTNMVSIDGGSSMPTLRPVLGYDKMEIVELAKRIGTYDLSIQEYKDCCSIVSRHPRTRMRLEDVDACVEAFHFEDLADASIVEGSLASYDPAGDSTSLRPLGVETGNVQGALAS